MPAMHFDLRPWMIIACGVLAPAGSAWAAGISTGRFGGEHGVPTTSNATAIYYNPAGITLAEGTHLYLDTMLAVRHATYLHTPHATDVPEPTGLEGANTDQATLLNLNVIPMLGATHKIGDFALGGGFYVPFGGGSSWSVDERFEDNVMYPGASGGAQRWHALDGEMRLLYWTLAAAYEIPETGLSLGVSGSLILSDITSNQARTAMGDNNMDNEGRSLLDVSTFAGGFGVGALFEAIDGVLWIGASYTSRPNVAGGHTLTGTIKNNFGSVDEVAAQLHQDMPDVIRLGVSYKPTPRLELRLAGAWERWSAFEGQCVSLEGEPCEPDAASRAPGEPEPLQNMRRGWHDTPSVRLGASYWITPRWEYFAGLDYDGNAIPDETLEAGLTDFHDFGWAAGMRYEVIEKHLQASLTYTHFINLPRDSSGKSELATAAESYNLAPDSGGRYTETLGLFNVSLEAAF